jgi:hypothetical protein
MERRHYIIKFTSLLWAKACSTAVYIQNRCLHKILEDKTQKEAFAGLKLKVSHFCIFGCLIYIHVPMEKRAKLEPSSKKGLYVGYSETSKIYRVYIPEQRKIAVSRDVKFEEDFGSRKSHEPIPITEDEEQETLKVEQRSPMTSSARQQPLGEEEETPTPSNSVKRP